MHLMKHTPRYRKVNSGLPSLFDEFFTPFFNEEAVVKPSSRKALAVDIYENEGNIIIEAEIPGVAKEDLHVDVKGKLLTLGGERKDEKEVKEENMYRRERSFGKFERTFTLPFDVKEDQVNASYNNGILTLEISKPEEQQVKQIKIN